MILLIQCSDIKNPGVGKARDIYAGPVTRLAIQFAEIKGWTPLILSAKYGIIPVDQIIESYDKRLKSYDGPWPTTPGFYIGGETYFRYAPDHLKRFFPHGTSYCCMKSFLNSEVHPENYGKKPHVKRTNSHQS